MNADSSKGSPLRLIDAAARGHRASLAGVGCLALAGGFAEAAALVLVARIAVALAAGQHRIHASLGPLGSVTVGVPLLIGVTAILVVVRTALQVGQTALMTRAFAGVWSDVRSRVVRLYIAASWSLQSGEREGRLQELLTTYALNAASTVLSLAVGLAALLSLVALVVTSFLVNPIAALAVVVGFVGVALILRPLRNTVRHRSRDAADANMTFATDTTELAGTMLETRIFNAEPQATDRIVQRIRDASELDRRARFISMLTPALYQGMALLLVVGALAVIDAAGVAHLSSLGAIVLIMIRSLSYGQALQSNYQSIYQTAPYFERLGTETDRYAAAAQPRDGAPFDRVGRLELDGVGYEYEPGRLVLQDVSLAIEPGEIVGIVGPSGSGKSTLVQLLLRLRKPTCGRVLAAGRDVEELSLDEWYRHVSFVPQEPRLLADTVAANIRFFRSDLDDERVQHAARLANLHDEITAMRHGYDTPVGERGGQLSGGQRQRLSIARAVVEEPDLLVLDEPTSSLDVRSEALIRESLRDLSARATVVIIAHRMSTLDICDRIMVIRGGVLEGYDTPERLEAVNPFYRDALQLSGLRDGG